MLTARPTLMKLALVAAAMTAVTPAHADVRHDEGIGLYVGLDSRATFPSGGYAGLPNPNFDRLTLLFDHGSHFHAVGNYSYAGAAPNPVVRPTSGSNSIPEAVSHGVAQAPLLLESGTGLYAGTLRSMVGGSEYSHLGMGSIQSLAGFGAGSPESVLYTSSGNRWSQPLNGVTVGLELLDVTPGLKIGNATTTDLFAFGNTILLGLGNSFVFDPVYWVSDEAAVGSYSAKFRLVDLSPVQLVGHSGEFNVRFQVAAAPVPEAETYAMLALGLPLVMWAVRRRRLIG